MLLKDISLDSPEENIVYDDILLQAAEEGFPEDVLRFWESPSVFVVLGRTGKIEEEINLSEITQDSIPVLRRSSGGGTVLQGKGCLNFSLILSKERDPGLSDLRKSYQIILNKVIEALKGLDIDCTFKPTSDLALVEGEKKFSGNAQRRARKNILHHGTVLYDFDLSFVEKYLAFPPQVPEYRKNRSHNEFIANIPVTSDQIKDALTVRLGITREQNTVSESEKKKLIALLEDKSRIIHI